MKYIIAFLITPLFLFSQRDSTKVFQLQDIYVEGGTNNEYTYGFDLEFYQNLIPFSNIISSTLPNTEDQNLYIVSGSNTTISLGTSFILKPQKFPKDFFFRINTGAGFRNGYSFSNTYINDSIYDTESFYSETYEQNVVVDSINRITSTVLGEYQQLRLNFEFVPNYKIFTTLDIYGGIGGNFGTYIKHDLVATQSESTRVNIYDEDNNLLSDQFGSFILESFSFERHQLYKGLAYSVYLPFGVNWQTSYNNNFFKHLIISLDGKYGWNINTVQGAETSFQKMFYKGIGFKWRL